MLLAVEVGNSNTVLGLFGDGEDAVATWRLATRRDQTGDDWFAILAALLAADRLTPASVSGVVLSSVVPPVTIAIEAMVRARFDVVPVVVGASLDLGLQLRVDQPNKIGADRLADCVAAFARYGGPAIVIDLGTATTFNVVSADGAFVGGAIAPGLALSLDALAGGAAQLFTVELTLPPRAIGTNTEDNLRSGLVLGHLAMLEGMVTRFRAELGVEAPVILTGGLSSTFAGSSPLFTHRDPNLTLDGLRLIYRRQRSSVASGG